MKNLRNILCLFVIVAGFLGCNDSKYKNYIIKHKDEIHRNDAQDSCYFIDSCNFNYYTDISIRLLDDNLYTVVFWGNRKSWLWSWKKDKYFTVDMESYACKRKNLEYYLDVKILDIIKDK